MEFMLPSLSTPLRPVAPDPTRSERRLLAIELRELHQGHGAILAGLGSRKHTHTHTWGRTWVSRVENCGDQQFNLHDMGSFLMDLSLQQLSFIGLSILNTLASKAANVYYSVYICVCVHVYTMCIHEKSLALRSD